MFDYDPITKDEAMSERYSLLPDGKYTAQINNCADRVSLTSGNPMFEINLSVYDNKGKVHGLKDFLVFTKNMMWKTINCCEACGVLDSYMDKSLKPHMLEGKKIIVDVGKQEGRLIPVDKLNGKPYGEKYPTKNVINDYVVDGEQKGMLETLIEKSKDFDDDIPF
jgi:hypothetical protein